MTKPTNCPSTRKPGKPGLRALPIIPSFPPDPRGGGRHYLVTATHREWGRAIFALTVWTDTSLPPVAGLAGPIPAVYVRDTLDYPGVPEWVPPGVSSGGNKYRFGCSGTRHARDDTAIAMLLAGYAFDIEHIQRAGAVPGPIPTDLAEATAGFALPDPDGKVPPAARCTACGRPSIVCSAIPCRAVLADRAEAMPMDAESLDIPPPPEGETFSEIVKRLGIVVRSTFVPWTESRSFRFGATLLERNLNWRVTLLREAIIDGMPKPGSGRQILTCDYNSAGLAHAPSYETARWTGVNGRPAMNVLDHDAILHETETGRAARTIPTLSAAISGKPILPDPEDVIACIALDASAIDYPSFESWAEDCGYDTDSRKAEATYRECLSHALALRTAIGDDELRKLRDLASDR